MATTSEYNSHFQDYEMNDLGDGTYETSLYFDLNNPVEWKFYIRAQTSDAMTLSPQRAEYEFYYFQPNAEINNINKINSIKVYPNPSNSIFNIFTEESNSINCEVFNLYGQNVLTKNILSNNITIDLKDEPDGIYLIKVNGEIIKIIKRK